MSHSRTNRLQAFLLERAWVVLLGAASGLSCVAVRLMFRGLQCVFTQHAGSLPEAAMSLGYGRRWITPILGAACAMLVLAAAKRRNLGQAFEEYVDAVRNNHGEVPFTATVWRTASSAFSVATGASIGREGSMIQFAAAVASWLGGKREHGSLAKYVSCGAAAAVAAAYDAPIAGTLFALEVVLGAWSWTMIPDLALAAFSGWAVGRVVLGEATLFAVHGSLSLAPDIAWCVAAALLMGVIAPWYQWPLRHLQAVRRWPAALLWAAFAVGLLSLVWPAVWGNGDVALTQVLAGSQPVTHVALLMVVRLLATALCVAAGTVGGVFTPTLFAGAAMGFVASGLLPVHQPVLLALATMVALLAAVTGAPWMAAAMVCELTGQWALAPLLVICALGAHAIAGRRAAPLSAIASPEPADSPELATSSRA